MLKNIKILIDNTVYELFTCLAEHGFSAYVETTDGNFLYDTGRDNVVVHNAMALNVDLKKLNAIILSHGHDDHTGGLEHVLKITGPIDVYAHPSVFEKKWLIKKDFKKDIGFAASKEKLEKLGARFHFSSKPTQITKDIWVSGQIPRSPAYRTMDKELYAERNGKLVIDDVPDDQVFCVIDNDGVNVLTGCTHAGIENALVHVKNITQSQNIKLLIGGLHLFKSDKQTILDTIKNLHNFNIKRLAVSHCTGFKATALLLKEFEDMFEMAGVGTTFGNLNS